MDLWIRSQDRYELRKVKGVVMAQEGRFFAIYPVLKELGELEILGQYKSEERALEVIDEIQNFLTPRFIVSTTSDNDCIENLFDKATAGKVFPSDRLEIKNINQDCWVYEMPQE